MAKHRIIKEADLKQLKTELIADIDEARNQAKVYREEEQQQKRTQADKIIIENAMSSVKFWNLRGDILHECLVKIERRTSEVEI